MPPPAPIKKPDVPCTVPLPSSVTPANTVAEHPASSRPRQDNPLFSGLQWTLLGKPVLDRTRPLCQRSSVLQVRKLSAYFEICLSARRRIGSTVSRLREYSIVFPTLWLVTSPQNARHLRLWEAMVCSILRASEIWPTFFGPFLSRFRMFTRYSFESALNSNERAVRSVFRRVSCWLMDSQFVIWPLLQLN